MIESVDSRSRAVPNEQQKLRPCPPHDVLARMGDKWTLMVLSLLAAAPGNRLRFSQVKGGIEGISRRMLTVTLRALERDGLLCRYLFAEVPPRVEYELTDLGQSVLPAMQEFTGWIRAHWPDIERARRSYDQRAPAIETSLSP